MSIDEGLYAWVEEALEPMGRVSLRKMMGGATLYLDGIIFGIMVDGELWMKSDAEADAIWDDGQHRTVHRDVQGRQSGQHELPPRAERRL